MYYDFAGYAKNTNQQPMGTVPQTLLVTEVETEEELREKAKTVQSCFDQRAASAPDGTV
jgi:hypothetical protein